MITNVLKRKCTIHTDIGVSANNTIATIETMTTSSATTILELPTELIEQICCCDSLKLIDVFNLAVSHSKLNNCLFGEQNSFLWKSKFEQKYGKLDKEEYEVVIDEQNTWKDEIIFRTSLAKTIPAEIVKMSCKFMKLMIIPYHMLPYIQYIHSNNENHRHYFLTAIGDFYKQQLSYKCCKKNYYLLYNAHKLLVYSCQVYFGYKLRNFLSLPPAEQIIERGFWLLGCWWSPTLNKPYRDINKSLNNIAINVWNHICSANPAHPLFDHKNSLNRVVEYGRINLDHDLFDPASTLFILENISQIVISNNICLCTNDFDCFLLQQVIDERKGTVFLLCVIFESVARRLGVKVHLTTTSDPICVSWSSSWPRNDHAPTRYLIDIAAGGVIYKDSVFTVSRQLPRYYNESYMRNLFWEFSKTMEMLIIINKVSPIYLLDFKKLFKPNDSVVELLSRQYHQFTDYFCQCPLLRNPLNPYAPEHENEKNLLSLQLQYADIFPLAPNKRGKIQDPVYSIGMMIEINGNSYHSYPNIVTERGIVVGWTRVTSFIPSPDPTMYHLLMKPHHLNNSGLYQNPVISHIHGECKHRILQRQLNPLDYSFHNIGKFFTHYSHKLGAFVPINGLAQLYPDDLSHTISESMSSDILQWDICSLVNN